MEFVWCWLDDSGQWIEYGKEHPNHATANVTSAVLEKKYQADKNDVVFFRAGSQQYKLDFADMVQTNVVFKTRRKVIRQPKKSQGGEDQSQNTTLSHPVYPPEWDQTALPEIGFKLVQVRCDSKEFRKIKTLFEKTMKNYCIDQLQRIQNPTLWDLFRWQKEKMKKIHQLEGVNERLLFHGADPSHLSAICEQNFDWRLCGTHGTMYGKGSYFARDAIYSHKYCPLHNGRHSMFVARVLVGEFVQGNPDYCRPPARAENSNRLYDSCVDNPTKPSIFVIFEKQQIYPAYILEYSVESSESSESSAESSDSSDSSDSSVESNLESSIESSKSSCVVL